VQLWLGVLDNNWLYGGASRYISNKISNMLDFTCHRSFVTGEWYMPKYRLRGLQRDDPPSISGDSSNGEVNVKITKIVLYWEGRMDPTREMAAPTCFLHDSSICTRSGIL
jgi:hypothetical protein